MKLLPIPLIAAELKFSGEHNVLWLISLLRQAAKIFLPSGDLLIFTAEQAPVWIVDLVLFREATEQFWYINERAFLNIPNPAEIP